MTRSPMARAVLLNAHTLDFDGHLDFAPIESVVSLARYNETMPEQIVERADGCRVLITKEMDVPVAVIEQLAPGTLICEAGTGVDNIESVAAAKARGIVVCNVPGYSTGSVAHLTMRHTLDLFAGETRRIRTVDEMDVLAFYIEPLRCDVDVAGRTMGVIGAGNIGRTVVRFARELGMETLVHTRTQPPPDDPDALEIVALDDLLAASDLVSIHVPFKKRTPPILGRKQLESMKSDAFLVNTARGGLIDQKALVELMQAGHLGGVALDVHIREPVPLGDPLLSIANVTITPHIGWKAIESRRKLVEEVAANINGFLHPGLEPRNVIEP